MACVRVWRAWAVASATSAFIMHFIKGENPKFNRLIQTSLLHLHRQSASLE